MSTSSTPSRQRTIVNWMNTSLVAPLEGWERGCFGVGTRGRGGRRRPHAKFEGLGGNQSSPAPQAAAEGPLTPHNLRILCVNKWISQPTSSTPTDLRLLRSTKFSPYFDNCVGALDGTHIRTTVRGEEAKRSWRNRYSYISTNVLAACDFSLRFVYVRPGYEGSANDQNVLNNALEDNFVIPKDRFYLADAGYGAHPGLRLPFRGVRYHLKEWGRANTRPRSKEELYNLRHA
ncbi:conserved hypothetical protein [Cryptococcus deneoformans JEC21]|uniref:DDE Tnp4 domain-containing protein n=1 Tax=Cryptococcus deneoformans (strain JEC21 / ATCC MYA-565) TaxID=214684 RepID=Q5KPF2_CRYD1|nr:conserved hypothetical protein [Cryptococcus neoformans var. neoformans JEC21]AAW40901.1 conserved hypothetical protein [Cryptococcus neoformans var. neoformans JEC21]